LPRGGWTVAYQSVSGPGQDWLGPSVDESVQGLSDQGITQAVICPFGFVADQVEILHDLDVVTKKRAEDLGVTVARAPLLNDGSALIDSLNLLVGRWDR
jgi:protoporphyrin/coproporphyrin ferrochelatase